jgi:WD40 repeat protein
MFKFEKKLLASSDPPKGKTYTQETKDRKGHTGSITSIAVSNSGNRLVSGSSDHSIKMWDINKGKVDYTVHDHPSASSYRYQRYVRSVAFSSTGHFASAANTDERNTLVWRDWNGPEDQSPSDISERYSNWDKHNSRAICIAFSPHGFRIVKGTEDGLVEMWKANIDYKEDEYGRPLGRRLWVEDDRLNKGAKLEKRFSDPSIPDFMIDRTDKPTTVKASHSSQVMSVAFNRTGDRIASGSADGTIKIWDVSSGALLHVLKGEGIVRSVEFSSDGTQIVSGVGDWKSKYKGDGTPAVVTYSNCEARIWDIEKGEIVHRIGHAGVVTSAKFNHDKTEPAVISGSTDGIIKISSVETGKLFQTLDHEESSVTSIVYSPKNERIFAGLDDGSIYIWKRASDNAGIYTALLSMKQIDAEIIAQYNKVIRKNMAKTAKTARMTVRARSAERAKSASSKNTRRVRSAERASSASTSPKNEVKAVAPKALTTKDPLDGRLLGKMLESDDVRRKIFEDYVKEKEPVEKTPARKTPARKPSPKEKTPESEYERESDSENDSENDSDSDSENDSDSD